MDAKRPNIIKTLLLKAAALWGWFPKHTTVFTPTRSTSIKCENCSLVNPSVWERCERCNAPLGNTRSDADTPAEPPIDLVKKV